MDENRKALGGSEDSAEATAGCCKGEDVGYGGAGLEDVQQEFGCEVFEQHGVGGSRICMFFGFWYDNLDFFLLFFFFCTSFPSLWLNFFLPDR